MTARTLTTLAGAVLAFGISATAVSDSSESNVASGKAASTEAARQLQHAATARRLARYGERAEDPLALITAARIMKRNPTSESKGAQADQGNGGGAQKDDVLALEPEALLERARELARDRADLVALADDVSAMGSKGRAGGPGELVTRVQAQDVDLYNEVFEADRPAQVAIQGDGDTDLDLHVYDENGNEICSSTSYSDYEYCEWKPRWTGEFEIRVKNYGGVWNGYVIMTN